MAAAETACPDPNPYCRVEARVRGPCGNEVAGFHPSAKSTSIWASSRGVRSWMLSLSLSLLPVASVSRGFVDGRGRRRMVFSLTSTPTLV